MGAVPPEGRRLGVKITLGFFAVVGLVLGTGALVDVLDGPTDYGGLPPPAGATVPDQLDPVAFSTQLWAAWVRDL